MRDVFFVPEKLFEKLATTYAIWSWGPWFQDLSHDLNKYSIARFPEWLVIVNICTYLDKGK